MARPTLTKEQIQTDIGAELLSLCQTMTSDGRILDEEIKGLKAWLNTHRGSDLPGIEFLTTIIEAVLADGKVTDEERKTVYAAIEKILPPDLRMIAQMHKRNAKAEDKAAAKRNAPLERWNFMIAGTRYEGRASLIKKHVSVGDAVIFRREPFNKYSRNAIAIYTKRPDVLAGYMIGYVPETDAVDMAAWLDNRTRHKAYVTKFVGYNSPIPVIDVTMYNTDADVEGLTLPMQPKQKESSSKKWIWAAIGLVILYLLAQ